VRVDLRAASVIPGDWKVRAGHLKEYFPISLPKIPGRDGAGVVTKLGPGVDYIAVGTPVCVVAQHIEHVLEQLHVQRAHGMDARAADIELTVLLLAATSFVLRVYWIL